MPNNLTFKDTNHLTRKLDALSKRWDDRLTSKDYSAIWEAYLKQRLIIIMHLKPRRTTQTYGEVGAVSWHGDRPDCDTIIAFGVNDTNIPYVHLVNGGGDEPVLVGSVGVSNFSNPHPSVGVRFDLTENGHCDSGKFHRYLSVGASRQCSGGVSRVRSRTLKGLTQLVPAFVAGEMRSIGCLPNRVEQPPCDVIERTVQVMEGVSNGEGNLCWNGIGSKGNCASSIRLNIQACSATITLDELSDTMFDFADVLVGPIDF